MQRSHAEEPQEKEDGDEQEERVLPVVVVVGVAVVWVTVGLWLARVLVCSVKGVIGVEDCCEEAEGERSDAKRHVEACVAQTLKHPASASALRLCPLSLRPRRCF